MCGARSNRLIITLFTGLLVVIPAASAAEQWQQSSAVDGVFVHLGIMPANVIRDHPEYYPEYHAQGTPRRGKISYHVVVAVFDAQSGKRIVDADVSARESPLALVGPEKDFQPLSVAGAVTYYNYFELSTKDTYTIKVKIRRPSVPSPV